MSTALNGLPIFFFAPFAFRWICPCNKLQRSRGIRFIFGGKRNAPYYSILLAIGYVEFYGKRGSFISILLYKILKSLTDLHISGALLELWLRFMPGKLAPMHSRSLHSALTYWMTLNDFAVRTLTLKSKSW